jgi:hypothetical protein
MATLRPLIATAFLVAAVGSTQVGMADTSSEMKEQSSRTVTEVPASPSGVEPGTQVETHTSMSKRQKEEADGSVQMQKKSSTTTEERATTADPLQPDTVHSETHSQEQTTKVTP